MTRRQGDRERRDELALISQEAAIAAVTAVAAAELGPAGAVVGALLGPYATLAAKRLRELLRRVEEAGLDRDTIVKRLEEDEAIAQIIAEVVRGTVESDLRAKRRLLAQAAIRALEDDAVVDEETVFVRTAAAIDTVDVRVLAIVGDPPERPEPDDPSQRRPEGTVFPDELIARWPGVEQLQAAPLSSLIAAGLIENAGIGTMNGLTFWKPTMFGRQFLDRLLEEGLEEELDRRQSSTSSTD